MQRLQVGYLCQMVVVNEEPDECRGPLVANMPLTRSSLKVGPCRLTLGKSRHSSILGRRQISRGQLLSQHNPLQVLRPEKRPHLLHPREIVPTVQLGKVGCLDIFRHFSRIEMSQT